MSEQPTATHEVIRAGISVGNGKELEPGSLVDASDWEPRLRHLWEQRGFIRPLVQTTPKGRRSNKSPAEGEDTDA